MRISAKGINAQMKPGTHICYSKFSVHIAKKSDILLAFKQKTYLFCSGYSASLKITEYGFPRMMGED